MGLASEAVRVGYEVVVGCGGDGTVHRLLGLISGSSPETLRRWGIYSGHARADRDRTAGASHAISGLRGSSEHPQRFRSMNGYAHAVLRV